MTDQRVRLRCPECGSNQIDLVSIRFHYQRIVYYYPATGDCQFCYERTSEEASDDDVDFPFECSECHHEGTAEDFTYVPG